MVKLLAPLLLLGLPALSAAQAPTHDYWVYVANESSDLVSRVRFGPGGAVEEATIPVGIMPADLDGPHGITVSPGGSHWYVSLAHGTPFGKVWKFEAGSERLVDSATAGRFPASMAITPDGASLFVVNFNLHGDHIPSSVSVIFTPFMRVTRQIETCIMPHGGKVSSDGRRHYSACMMDDQLVEIATDSLAVVRRLALVPGHERVLGDDHASHAMEGARCRPTWVAVSPDDRRLYVPCNGHQEVLEIDALTLAVTRRFPTGKGPYNADVSPDGTRLVVTLKGGQAVLLVDLRSGRTTEIRTTQPVTHGVAITPDSRYAFVSNEAIGAIRGTVDVIDLRTATRVASVPVQHQPGGIAFWKMEPARATAGP